MVKNQSGGFMNQSNSSSVRSFGNIFSFFMGSDPILSNLIMFFIIVIVIYYVYLIYMYYRQSCPKKVSLWRFLTGTPLCSSNSSPIPVPPIPSIPSIGSITNPLTSKKEVFHIRDQIYTYDQAKCKCASYGAELATYEQIVDAFNQGADWCTYGWSHGQKAYYPTQPTTYEKLQKGPQNLQKTCGKPGINGGSFTNTKLKFGVNCYGVKPNGRVVKPIISKTPTPERRINTCSLPENKDIVGRKETDEIAPFNSDKWNN